MPLIHELFLLTLQKLCTAVNVFELTLKLNGFPIGKAKDILRFVQQKNEGQFQDYMRYRKQKIVSYHLVKNPFYSSFAKHADPKEWDSVPIMTKRDLQQPLANRLSQGFSKKNIHTHKTSGSSGDPFIFAKDKFCHALTWAGFMDRYNWFGLDINTSKQARFYGIPLHKKGYYKERFKDMLGNRHRFSVFDLSDAALQLWLKKFELTAFHYINGYTSSIVQFAKYLNRQHVVLKTVCPSLKCCIVTSEMLFDSDRKLLETQLGVPVVNEYGAAELGLIAFQNSDNEWIVNHEDLFVEILDDNDVVLPYGEEGRIVVTALYNKAHPFIRYDLGDIGILSKESTLHKPILKKLTGRTNDIAVLPSGKKAAGLTFYYITKSIIEDRGNVKEFVIEQHGKNTFKIKYTSDEKLSEEHIKKINREIETYLEKGLEIAFERLENIDRSKNGKLKQFTSFL